MRFLKLFESFRFDIYLKDLEERTSILKIRDEIWDHFLDLGDDFSQLEISKKELMINAKDSNGKKINLNVDHLENVAKAGDLPKPKDIKYLENFLDKFVDSTDITGKFWVRVGGDYEKLASEELISQINNIKSWANSQNIDVDFSHSDESKSKWEEAIKVFWVPSRLGPVSIKPNYCYVKFTFDLESKF